ncbi:hypothetical protein K457DRAFT_133034 [Linnemannia elongata AG-77]|uniref:Uncharacterized protein n=1 Tax=Linnemannia elongata AG-77 TaxID=1314771 RepID=A0A197KET8_9FUNG|nr:hypothetical protein K457DRAFT_133034 [Linnemannia elongata AG-77]
MGCGWPGFHEESSALSGGPSSDFANSAQSGCFLSESGSSPCGLKNEEYKKPR